MRATGGSDRRSGSAVAGQIDREDLAVVSVLADVSVLAVGSALAVGWDGVALRPVRSCATWQPDRLGGLAVGVAVLTTGGLVAALSPP